MNNFFKAMSVKNNPHATVAIYSAALIEILKIWLPQFEPQLTGTQKVLTWYGILSATTSGTPPAAASPSPADPPASDPMTRNPRGKITPAIILIFLASFLFP